MTARILIVDDNPENLDLMVYILRAFHYDVSGFTRATDALLAPDEPGVDLILSDIRMPECDGYTFSATVKAMPGASQVPVVAVTASAMVGDRERILSAGFNGYITKPIEPQSFLQTVESFLPPELRNRR